MEFEAATIVPIVGKGKKQQKRRANISNNPEIIKLYKKQRNNVVNLSRKVKAEYFQRHIPHDAFSKFFWKFCEAFFSNKTTNFDEKIILRWKKEK